MKFIANRGKEKHFTRNGDSYYYVKHEGIWELFKLELRKMKYKDTQEVYVRIAIGTSNKGESIKKFEELIRYEFTQRPFPKF